jgi:hypothetical protein
MGVPTGMIYRFALVEGSDVNPDDEGVELPDLSAARTYAIKSARDILASDIRQGILALGMSIQISDANHNQLLLVRFTDAVINNQIG